MKDKIMAATIDKTKSARVLVFRRKCKGVNLTDRKRRLPPISSAEVETIFDHALAKNTCHRAV